ncbi:flavin reductase family protein [Streptomyces roseicoloratus]|uniref:Flavin reductase family protein n=1 Tax=Streptomyces roseicoloratus TaxID=2508722 RepID=A0ABY9RQR7_9ACTN|nr:flavin reductase family protein [Streptomyces roseicoloratus]WMX44093.1 flavin reductase family protein [Streptomyces roseicoloratus]
MPAPSITHARGTTAGRAPADLRDVMRRYPTGVTVLSSGSAESAVAMTVNAFTSVSLDPPRVLVSVMKTARAHPVITASGRLGIHLLAAHQGDVARLFASREKPSGHTLGAYLDRSAEGHDVLPGALASLACEIEDTYSGGDHSLFLARVLHTTCTEEPQDALVFHQGRFTSAAAERS